MPELADASQLYLDDAYLRDFSATVVEVDAPDHRVVLDRTAFYPGGGGQPNDEGRLEWDSGSTAVTKVSRQAGVIWHWLDPQVELPEVGAEVKGALDWDRRYALMRAHTALHILNGVVWLDHGVQVTGANMTPGEGRIDFELPSMSAAFGQELEQRANEQVRRDLPVRVLAVPRSEADHDESLIRSKADLIPRSIDPLRVVEIVGLDRQADGGTHVASTGEVGRIVVTKTESKGKGNKRVRIRLD